MGLVKSFGAYLMTVMLSGLVFALGLSNGYKFYVGGKDGWVLTPSEDYSHWSHRNRFQVNDTLYFKYTKGKDSVLEWQLAHHSHSPRQSSPSPSPALSPVALSSPAPSPGVVLSDSGPAKARNSAGLVGPGMVSLGLVLGVVISSMV
ncbi:hypothetical protein Bca101_053518 [Brassica carinata]